MAMLSFSHPGHYPIVYNSIIFIIVSLPIKYYITMSAMRPTFGIHSTSPLLHYTTLTHTSSPLLHNTTLPHISSPLLHNTTLTHTSHNKLFSLIPHHLAFYLPLPSCSCSSHSLMLISSVQVHLLPCRTWYLFLNLVRTHINLLLQAVMIDPSCVVSYVVLVLPITAQCLNSVSQICWSGGTDSSVSGIWSVECIMIMTLFPSPFSTCWHYSPLPSQRECITTMTLFLLNLYLTGLRIDTVDSRL